MKRAPDGVVLKVGERVLLERTHLMALLGLATANWSKVEEELALLYAYLLGQRGPREEFGHPIEAYGVQVFRELAACHQRKRLLVLLIEDRLSENEAKVFEKSVIAPIELAARRRNQLVHTRLAVSDEFPDTLVTIPLVGDMQIVEESDFNEALDSIEGALRNLVAFAKQVRDALNRAGA